MEELDRTHRYAGVSFDMQSESTSALGAMQKVR